MKDEKRNPHALYCDDPSLAKQADKRECDVNEILKRAASGQDISRSLSQRIAQYGDFTNMPDFREAFNTIKAGEAMFMELDWQTRERFGNDPAKMIEFLQDDKNRAEAEKLGLVTPKPAEPANPAPPVPAPAA